MVKSLYVQESIQAGAGSTAFIEKSRNESFGLCCVREVCAQSRECFSNDVVDCHRLILKWTLFLCH